MGHSNNVVWSYPRFIEEYNAEHWKTVGYAIVPIATTLSHAFIIIGEAIAVLFFLHHAVEQRTANSNRLLMSKSAQDITTTFNDLLQSFDMKGITPLSELGLSQIFKR